VNDTRLSVCWGLGMQWSLSVCMYANGRGGEGEEESGICVVKKSRQAFSP